MGREVARRVCGVYEMNQEHGNDDSESMVHEPNKEGVPDRLQATCGVAHMDTRLRHVRVMTWQGFVRQVTKPTCSAFGFKSDKSWIP